VFNWACTFFCLKISRFADQVFVNKTQPKDFRVAIAEATLAEHGVFEDYEASSYLSVCGDSHVSLSPSSSERDDGSNNKTLISRSSSVNEVRENMQSMIFYTFLVFQIWKRLPKQSL
jgi:hypothetical protein